MGKLKDILDVKMLDTKYYGRVLFKEASLDDKLKRHFKLKTKLIDSVGGYSTYECVVTIKSDEELSDLITKLNIVRLFRNIEEPLGYLNDTPYAHIVKAIDVSSTLSEDKNTMEIVFHLVTYDIED